MLRRVVLYGGLLLVCLLLGQLALHATDVGNIVLEKSTASKATSTKQNVTKASDAEMQAKAADRARVTEKRSQSDLEQRKVLEAAAQAAGWNPGRLGEASDAELTAFVKNTPVAKTPTVTPGADMDVLRQSEDLQTLKARLVAEERAHISQPPAVTSSSTGAGATLPGSRPEGKGPNADEERVRREAEDAAAAKAESMNTLEPWAPAEQTYNAPAEPLVLAPVVDVTTEAAVDVDIEAQEFMATQQRMDRSESLSKSEKDQYYRYLAEHPEAGSHGGHGSLDNVGGPDGAGYSYVDNVAPAPDTTTYAWIELRGDVGVTYLNTWTSHDDGYSYVGTSSPGARLPLGMTFPFYGVMHDSFRVCTNGFIQFTTTATSYSDMALPRSDVAGPAIFPYNDDQHLDRNGQLTDQVMYKNLGTYTVIEWDSIGVYNSTCGAGGPTNTLKYQVILFNDGKIKIQYNTVAVCDAQDTSMTVGIQSNGVAGSAALQYGYGTGANGSAVLTGHLPATGLAIWFYPTVHANDFAIGGITAPTASLYAPNQVLSVSGRFYNMGTTTESAPVKYSFDGGATVEEATASLTPWSSETHAFSTSITMPATDGSYVLTMWSDLVTDEVRANDTARVTLQVFAGGSCASAIELTTAGPDSATWNNAGAGNNSPGVSCATTTYADMAFKKDVLAGHTLTMWVSSISATSKSMHAMMRYQGACPGDSLVKCVTYQSAAGPTGYNQKFIWVNTTGATKTVYFVYGNGYSGTSYTGNFVLAWQDTDYSDDFAVTSITSPLTSAYVPSQVVTVTGTAINYGSTTQGTPISYSFNGGSAVTEATASLARFATEAHTFAAQITLPATNGTYPLSVWTDLAADQDRTNDTLKMNVTVFGGANCATAMVLPAGLGTDSSTFNNCGAGNNDPGTTCYPTSSYADMVFSKVVDPGHTVTFWVSSMSASSKYLVATLRWGGSCPGTNIVDCPTYMTSAPAYNRRFTWTNSTGATQTAFFTMGNYYSGTSYCNNIKLAWQDQICPAVDAPYSQGFEGILAVPFLPTCMTQENDNNLNPVWEGYATTPRTGTKCATISGLAAGHNDWLFTSGINMEEGRDYFVSYWRRVNSASYPDSIEVMAGLAPTAAAMTISVAAMDSCKRTAYTQKLGGFTAPTTEPYYIGWHSVSKTSSARTIIDDIQVDASTVCTSGTVAANAAVGADSVLLTTSLAGNWYGGIPKYQWYTGDVVNEANRIVGANQSSYRAYTSGAYTCRVYVVDSTTCVASDSALATVIDCMSGATMPFYEPWSTAGLPICWTTEDLNADGYKWTYGSSYYTSSPYSAYFYVYSTVPANDWLFWKPVQLTAGTTYRFEYWRRVSSSACVLHLAIGTSRSVAAMTTDLLAPYTFSNTTFVKDSVDWSPPTTGVYYVGLQAANTVTYSYVYVDDFAIYRPGIDCATPLVTMASQVAADSVVLTAAASGGFGGPIEYQWFTGATCDAGNEIVGANARTYTTFASGTFACKVWCGNATTCDTCVTATATVINCAIAATPPLEESFEFYHPTTYMPPCWSKENVGAITPEWTNTTGNPHSGVRAAYISYNSSNPLNDWLFSRGVQLTAGTTYYLNYWYRSGSTSYVEQMETYMGDAAVSTSMTTLLRAPWSFQDAVYHQAVDTIVVGTSGVYYIGFHAISITDQLSIYFDDVQLYEAGTCSAPTTVNVPAASGQSAVTLTCTALLGFGGALQYQWYTGATCAAGNEIVGATTNQYTAFSTGIYSCKAYYCDIDLYGNCDSAQVTIVTDPCLPGATVPYYENWDAVAGLPDCWSQQNANADGYSWSYGSSYYVSSPYAAYLYTSTTLANDWLFWKPLQLTAGTNYRISYWRRASSTTYAQTLKLAIGTLRHSAGMTTELIAPYTFNNTVFIQDFVDYTPTVTGSYYLGLQNTTSVSGGSVYVDDFRIFRRCIDCGAPATVTVASVTAPDTVTLTCVAIGGYGGTLRVPVVHGWQLRGRQ